MKSRIVSVSRRTDVPAFYGEWFMNRIADGYAGYVNPFGGQRYLVDLRPQAVHCFVFWSKNYGPFLDRLASLDDLGYRAYFNYTITGLPLDFESNLVPPEEAVESLGRLSETFSPEHINWRYDPVVLSNLTPAEWHLERFRSLAAALEGRVKRCYFSFAVQYGKVQRSFSEFQKRTGIVMRDPDLEQRRELAGAMADIAGAYGMTLHTCCGDDLVNDRIFKAHCIDADIIRRLFREDVSFKALPTRKECGCCESADIGKYDTCPHGCIYCYANINKRQAAESHERHDPASVFLGYSKAQSDEWMRELVVPGDQEPETAIRQMQLL